MRYDGSLKWHRKTPCYISSQGGEWKLLVYNVNVDVFIYCMKPRLTVPGYKVDNSFKRTAVTFTECYINLRRESIFKTDFLLVISPL